jgi:hypothetical protein
MGTKPEDSLSVTVELKGQNETLGLASMGYILPRTSRTLYNREFFLPQNACYQML